MRLLRCTCAGCKKGTVLVLELCEHTSALICRTAAGREVVRIRPAAHAAAELTDPVEEPLSLLTEAHDA